MAKTREVFKSYLKSIWRTICRFARAPFQNVPPAFGDTVPPELRVFESRVDEMQHHAVAEVAAPKGHGHRASKARH